MRDLGADQVGDEGHVQGDPSGSKSAAAEMSAAIAGDVRRGVEGARESATAVFETVKARAGELGRNVTIYIRRNPYKSLAIAGGIGLLAGLLLRRR